MNTSEKPQQQIPRKGQWQWKSNADPWSKSEEEQWTSYTSEQNDLIEKAFSDQKYEVDIGDYIVSIKHHVQWKKSYTMAQRPIRRIAKQEDEEFEIRCQRYFETESPKTMNSLFGSIEDFIDFFSKRNQDLFNFAKQFTEYERCNNIDKLNEEIIPKLVASLTREWEKPARPSPNNLPLSPFAIKIQDKVKKKGKELIVSFQERSMSFDEFYGQIFKAYTMGTFLYPNLNRYLRNESWTDISDLLPYAFCLCKAFLHSNSKFSLDENLKSKSSPSFYLYRGTGLDEGALRLYETKTNKYFSWNAVTSTTEDLNVAKKFMNGNKDLKNKISPVMFKIEVPTIESGFEVGRLRDVRNYSAFPQEAEIVLAPGSVFQLEAVEYPSKNNRKNEDNDEITTIKLKLKINVETLAHEGQMMPGAYQKEMVNQREAKIICLEGQELIENLELFPGNQLIQELEFCNCRFNNKSLKAMMKILSTLKQVSCLKFISCEYDDDRKKLEESLSTKLNLEIKRLEVFDLGNFCEIIWEQIFEPQSWKSMQVLDLKMAGSAKTTDTDLYQISFQILMYTTKLKSLSLHLLRENEITDEGISVLSQGVGNLVELESLCLDFRESPKITDQGIKELSVLKDFAQLKSLSLNLKNCSKVTNEGIRHFSYNGLSSLVKLSDLELLFGSCPKVDGEGLSLLSLQGLRFLPQLKSLTLDFSRLTQQNTNNMEASHLSDFASQGLRPLTQLTHLDLNFAGCFVNDEGIESLCSQGLRHLRNLTSLNLNFNTFKLCLTDKAIENLCREGIKHLDQLKDLNLVFWYCQITDTAIGELWFEGLMNLKLKSLSLTFLSCEVTKTGLYFLCEMGREAFSQLEYLNLDFKSSPAKKDPELMVFRSLSRPKISSKLSLTRGLKKSATEKSYSKIELEKPPQDQIPQEKSFSPNGVGKFKLTQSTPQKIIIDVLEKEDLQEDDLKEIGSMLDQNSAFLQSLTVSFANNSRFNPDILEILWNKLGHLNQLESLNLDLTSCPSVFTDGQMIRFCSSGLQNLLNLRNLSLQLNSCSTITEKGIEILCTQGLQHLSTLQHLSLDFGGFEFADDALEIFCCQGLEYLPKLRSLDLILQECRNVTDEGINQLCAQGIRNLRQLT